MVKNKILFFIFLAFGVTTNAQKVSNITFKQEQSNIVVSYDLETKTTCKIDLFVSTNGGATWQGPLKKVIGDVGDKVVSGKHSIVWSVLEEFNELSGTNIKFQVRAEEPKTQSITAVNNAILKNPKDAKLYKLRGDLKYDDISNNEDGKYSIEDARADYKKAILLNPKYADAYKALGNLERGLSAIPYYDKAIVFNPNDADIYFQKGLSYFNNENYDYAIFNFNIAIEMEPKNIKFLLQRGKSKFHLKEISGFEDINKVIELDSTNPINYKVRGIQKLDLLNNIEESKIDFNNYIRNSSFKEQSLNDVGKVFLRRNKYSEAIDYFSITIDRLSKPEFKNDTIVDSDYESALIFRGMSKQKLGDIKGSEIDFGTYISEYRKINSFNVSEPIINICDYFVSYNSDPLGALLFITSEIKKEPKLEYYKKRAKLKIQIKDYKGAILDYTYAIELKPDFNSYSNRASAKEELKDYSGAIADYSKAIVLEPKDADNYIARAESKNNIKDYIGAIADLNKALEINPTLDYLYFRRANNKFNLGDFRGAISDYSKYIIKNPQDAESYYNRGDAKYNINDFNGAIADYTKTISLDPKYAEAYLWRGNAKIEIKDKIGACKDFSKAGELELKEAYDAINKNCN